jgi:hypothetical protein
LKVPYASIFKLKNNMIVDPMIFYLESL